MSSRPVAAASASAGPPQPSTTSTSPKYELPVYCNYLKDSPSFLPKDHSAVNFSEIIRICNKLNKLYRTDIKNIKPDLKLLKDWGEEMIYIWTFKNNKKRPSVSTFRV